MEDKEKILVSKRLLHDLNNKLNIISCYSSSIRLNEDKPPEIERNLKIISETAMESGNIVYMIQDIMVELLKSIEEKG